MGKVVTPYPNFCKGERSIKVSSDYKPRGTPAKENIVGKGIEERKSQKAY